MPDDGAHRNGAAGLVGLDLVVDVADQAMRGREHKVRRERGAGAQILARIHDHYDGARGPAGRRRRIAGNGGSGGGEQQEGDGGEDAEHGVHQPWRGTLSIHALARLRRTGTDDKCEPRH